MSERGMITALVIGLGAVAAILALIAWNEMSLRSNVYGNLVVGVLVAALIVIELYKIWRK